jgi:hypothetical protein
MPNTKKMLKQLKKSIRVKNNTLKGGAGFNPRSVQSGNSSAGSTKGRRPQPRVRPNATGKKNRFYGRLITQKRNEKQIVNTNII